MKVLIADDEQHVIQAISLLVPWRELGIDQVFAASSGAETLAVIERETPEIVITDIVMDDMSGMDIMNYIASRHPTTKVVAISGYNDFEYVRTMLTKGCIDYLIKPLESHTLIAAIQKVVESWNAEHEHSLQKLHLKEKMHSLSTFYASVLLYKMLDSCNWAEAYQKLLQADTRFVSISNCKILYYNTGFFPMRNTEFANLIKTFTEQTQRLLQNRDGMLLSNPQHPDEVSLFLYDTTESMAASILKLARSLFGSQRFPFHIGLSRNRIFPEHFSEAYCQAKDAFLNTCADQGVSAMAIASFPNDTEPVFLLSPDPLQRLENQIFSILLAGHKKDLDTAISDWLNDILPEQNCMLSQIQYAMDQFHKLLRQWIIQIRKQKPSFSYEPPKQPFVYEDLTDEHFRFSRAAFQQAIRTILHDICDALIENHSSNDIMHQIARYIEQNYEKPFVQSEYAQRFFLNKDYMSRKFTSTFGVSMLALLNQIRIRHAKELLGDSSLKIQDIAYSVGFKDEKYFAKQFKKLTDTSPADYRAALKIEKQES